MSQLVSKDRAARLDFYRKKGKVHARETGGRFNTLRWAMVWLTQIVFYGTCWLNWENNGLSRQAVLFDIAHEKFYFFGLVLWPQDALLLAIVLILAATGLFLATAMAGRVFCGFACPQTVYTATFTYIQAGLVREAVCQHMCPYFRPEHENCQLRCRAWRAAQPSPPDRQKWRLHRLWHLRTGLPDRHRHSRWPAIPVHQLRLVRRCL